jgi:dolichyl-phosphate beta-glucosyltransferase
VSRSLVVPMFNEVGRIETTLTTLAASTLRVAGFEVVLVDDGSTDGTTSVAKHVVDTLGWPDVQFCSLPANRGKGAAVREGMLAANGATRVFVDADLSVRVDDIERCFAALEDGDADVAYGTRAHPDSAKGRTQPLLRVFTGRAFNMFLRSLGLVADRDTQCGLKGFRKEAAHAIFSALVTDGFAFDVEVLARASRGGYRVVTLPVTWSHVEASRVRPLRDGLDMARAAIVIRRRLRAERRGLVTSTLTAADVTERVQ